MKGKSQHRITPQTRKTYGIRVCRLSRSFPDISKAGHGIGSTLLYLSREQTKQGLSVDIVATREPGEPESFHNEGILVHRVGRPYSVFSVVKLRELSEVNKINIVHGHLTASIGYGLCKHILGIPLVVHIHATHIGALQFSDRLPFRSYGFEALAERSSVLKSILRERIAWRDADRLIAVSRSVREELVKYYKIDREKIRVVHNAVDTERFKPTTARKRAELRKALGLPDKKVILYVGHFGLRKGVHYLVKAIPKVKTQFDNVLLLMVGGTPKFIATSAYWDLIRVEIERMGIPENIELVDEVPYERIPQYYAAADVFALPTLYEGLPKVLLEAMASQLPILATKVCGIPEAITNEKSGLLVDARDPDQIAEGLIRLIDDEKDARRLGKEARKRVEKDFTWKRAANKVLQIYKELFQ